MKVAAVVPVDIFSNQEELLELVHMVLLLEVVAQLKQGLVEMVFPEATPHLMD
tara:strand:+ start:653 stop:811 length:159 start_codon:yes stop_codon:yes gene_type:complete